MYVCPKTLGQPRDFINGPIRLNFTIGPTNYTNNTEVEPSEVSTFDSDWFMIYIDLLMNFYLNKLRSDENFAMIYFWQCTRKKHHNGYI